MKENSALLNRRQFLMSSILAGAGLAIPYKMARAQNLQIIGANNRLRIGIVGLNLQGCQHLNAFTSLPNVEIAGMCDFDSQRLRQISYQYEKENNRRPVLSDDPRRLFESADIDAVCITAPLIKRTGIALEAVEAGKDVFIESPFCNSITEAKNLVDGAAKHKRLVGQNENAAFQYHRNLADYNGIFSQEFTSAVGLASFTNDDEQFLKAKNSKYENSVSSKSFFPQNAYSVLDVSRNILNVGMPSRVSTLEAPDSLRRAVEFEFFINGKPKNLSLEIQSSNSDGRLRRGIFVEPNNSRLNFFSSEGDFQLDIADSLNTGLNENCWENFVSCLRNGNADAIQNPISEARKSIALLHLANMSYGFRRSINFDPLREVIIDDPEINNCL